MLLRMDAAADIIALYRRHARAWTAARGVVLHERGWMERFAAAAGDGAEVLDIGCGSGEPVARFLTGLGHGVTGIDSAPEMIAMFAGNFPHRPALVADMRTLALGKQFGGVLAWDSLFHLTGADQRGMFPVFAAHALPGAALMFTSGRQDGVALGELEGDVLFHASLAPDAYRALLAETGFEVLGHAVNDPTCGGRTVWLARKL
jgi:SAM-dependent methyltransferase